MQFSPETTFGGVQLCTMMFSSLQETTQTAGGPSNNMASDPTE